MAVKCEHLKQVRSVTPGCEDCLKTGDSRVYLRIRMTRGHGGCCDSSKNRHARKHFHAAMHPIIKSFEHGEDWMWCYIGDANVLS